MGRKRRSSSHRNKLYDDSSAWGIAVVIILVVVAIVVVSLIVWFSLDEHSASSIALAGPRAHANDPADRASRRWSVVALAITPPPRHTSP